MVAISRHIGRGLQEDGKTVKRFKDKWFNGDRSERLKPIVERKIEGLRKELTDMIGEE